MANSNRISTIHKYIINIAWCTCQNSSIRPRAGDDGSKPLSALVVVCLSRGCDGWSFHVKRNNTAVPRVGGRAFVDSSSLVNSRLPRIGFGGSNQQPWHSPFFMLSNWEPKHAVILATGAPGTLLDHQALGVDVERDDHGGGGGHQDDQDGLPVGDGDPHTGRLESLCLWEKFTQLYPLHRIFLSIEW